MSKPKVYLETSFISYLTGRETSNVKIAADQAYTRRWWEVEGPRCELFVSRYVADESTVGRKEQIQKAQRHNLGAA